MKHEGPRILIIVHGHPDFNIGGAEIAAYNLFRAYSQSQSVSASYFLGRYDQGEGPTGRLSSLREREYIWQQGIGDWFKMRAANTECLLQDFAELLRELNPTVVHIHHYVHMGLEFIHVLKRICPDVKIIMTLHEYAAICFNQGQMIKSNSNELCYRESPEDCKSCFPDRSAEDFWLRKHRFLSFFRMVDLFVSPSAFLKSRYVDWGIDPAKIVIIENGQSNQNQLPPRQLAENETRNRFGYFGQITPFKGIDVLLRGFANLPQIDRDKIRLEVHGANLEQQSEDLIKNIHGLRAVLREQSSLHWIGPYQPAQLASRMAAIDWVVVPSIWWENSPMVIQEAYTFGRPVVGSNIGGIAEKITDGIDGIHVPVADPDAWGAALSRLSQFTDEWDHLRAGIRRPLDQDECARAHLELIAAL